MRRRTAKRPVSKTRQTRQPRTPAIPADILAVGSLRSTATPTIGRTRRTLASIEQGEAPPVWRDDSDRMMSAARSGHDEFVSELHQHTEASPALTAGDVDARWQDAYAVGDEAPGGDNPTPDQDRVDDIGRALGIEYRDDQELQGGEEVTKRDRRRWELDPASSEEWPRK